MKKIVYVLLAISLVMISSISLLAQKKKTVAVLEFVSSDLAKSDVTNLSNRFRALLGQTQAFDLLEREKMNEILKAQDFNISDNCNTSECAVRVGELLGVEYMVAGDIGKIGQVYTIDLRMIDIATSKIIQSKSEDYKGEIEGLLEIMKMISNTFAGIKSENSLAKISVMKSSQEIFGSAIFQLNIEGVTPTINGVAGNPVFSKSIKLNLSAGVHKIKFTKSGYGASQEFNIMIKENEDVTQSVELREDKTAILGVDLSLNYGIVSISSSPAGAKVLDLDIEIGSTPLSGIKLSVGSHTLILKKSKYYPQSIAVDIKDGLNRVPEKTLAPNFGTLNVSSTPAGAKIKINGILKEGVTPQVFEEFQSGAYEIEVEKERYFLRKKTVEISDLTASDLAFLLKPQFSDITITSTPSGAKVYLDKKYVGTTPLNKKGETNGLVAGIYNIRLTMNSDLYRDYEDAITIKAGEPLLKTFELKSNFGTIKILADKTDIKTLVNGIENKDFGMDMQIRLKPGTYEIELIKDKHHPIKKTISLSKGALEIIQDDFTAKQGRIMAYSVPDGAEFTLIDEMGKEIYEGKNLDQQVLEGSYTVKTQMKGYGRIKEKTVQVTEGYKEPIEITFTEADKRQPVPLSKAYLSILMPGLGGYFTEKEKTRSVVTAVSAVGLIAYGMSQKSVADKFYSDYKSSTNKNELSSLYNKATSANHTYFITTRIGATIWIADIIWVVYKDIQNKKESYNLSTLKNSFELNYNSNELQLGYTVSF